MLEKSNLAFNVASMELNVVWLAERRIPELKWRPV
jgi:hypothetical protein